MTYGCKLVNGVIDYAKYVVVGVEKNRIRLDNGSFITFTETEIAMLLKHWSNQS